MTKFLLDTNILIEAKARYCRFSFCPAFWDWIRKKHELGTVASFVAVADEIRQENDDLTEWVNQLDPTLFEAPNDTVIDNQKKVAQHVQNLSDFTQAKKYNFLKGADTWLIAHAMASNCTVVTEESFSQPKKKIKIPNVCQHFSIPYKKHI